MSKLFVDKTITIHATPERVWEALTSIDGMHAWVTTFSGEGPKMHLGADWQLGGTIDWILEDGSVAVTGKVTAFDPRHLLRFTVEDTRASEKFLMGEEDGITFKITEEGDKTHLQVLHGDFGIMPDGEKYRDMSAPMWDKVLPVIKSFAEAPRQQGAW